jgi:hypothetical protein
MMLEDAGFPVFVLDLAVKNQWVLKNEECRLLGCGAA